MTGVQTCALPICNYPKDVPIMVSMDVGMEGRGGLNVGKKEPTHIKITIKPSL